MPFLYFLGWLFVQPLSLLSFNFQRDELSLIGTLITFFLFIFLLPSWIKCRWKNSQPWLALGIKITKVNNGFSYILKGLLEALFLILIVLIPIWGGGWVENTYEINSGLIINGILLGIGVGVAEEIVFRGWLLEELNLLLGPRLGIFVQAVIFSLAHIRFKLTLNELIPLLIGLFLLGLILALRRIIDRGSLWGSISLHGGLVGGWFVINSGMIRFSSITPSWLIGQGKMNPNPIGGIIAILSMSLIVFVQRKAFSRLGRLVFSTVNDSFNGARP